MATQTAPRAPALDLRDSSDDGSIGTRRKKLEKLEKDSLLLPDPGERAYGSDPHEDPCRVLDRWSLEASPSPSRLQLSFHLAYALSLLSL